MTNSDLKVFLFFILVFLLVFLRAVWRNRKFEIETCVDFLEEDFEELERFLITFEKYSKRNLIIYHYPRRGCSGGFSIDHLKQIRKYKNFVVDRQDKQKDEIVSALKEKEMPSVVIMSVISFSLLIVVFFIPSVELQCVTGL